MLTQIIAHMLVCLLLAGVLGAAIGWLLRGILVDEKRRAAAQAGGAEQARALAAAREQVEAGSRERAEQGTALAAFEQRAREQAALLEEARTQHGVLAEEMRETRGSVDAARAHGVWLEAQLKEARGGLEEARARGARLEEQLKEARGAEGGGRARAERLEAELGEAQRALRECRARGQELDAEGTRQRGETAAALMLADELGRRLAAAEKDLDAKRQRLVEQDALRARIAELEAAARPVAAAPAAAPAEPAAAPAPAPGPPPSSESASDLLRIEGIGDVYCAALRRAGVPTQAALLARGATPQGRHELALATEISDKLVLRWVNHVDLMRVQGMDEQRAELLEAAGVDSVPELAQRKPENLHKRLVDVNRGRALAPRPPAIHEVKSWVSRARQLPRAVFHENPPISQPAQRGASMSRIIDIEGIGPVYGEKLAAAGVHTVEELLEAGATPQGRSQLAERTGIGDALVLKWVNHADLFRVIGVASEFAELLEAAGVDTVRELAQRDADHLRERLAETNQGRELVRALPSRDQVQAWIDQAAALPRKISY